MADFKTKAELAKEEQAEAERRAMLLKNKQEKEAVAVKVKADEVVQERARRDLPVKRMSGGSEEAPFFVSDAKYDGARFNVPKVQIAINALNGQIAALKPDAASGIVSAKANTHINVLEGIVADLVDAIR